MFFTIADGASIESLFFEFFQIEPSKNICKLFFRKYSEGVHRVWPMQSTFYPRSPNWAFLIKLHKIGELSKLKQEFRFFKIFILIRSFNDSSLFFIIHDIGFHNFILALSFMHFCCYYCLFFWWECIVWQMSEPEFWISLPSLEPGSQ